MRRSIVVAAIALAGCQPPRPEPLRDPPPAPSHVEPVPGDDLVATYAAALRAGPRPILVFHAQPPAVDGLPPLPDPTTHALRWPLSGAEHPSLAPRFDVAAALAEPGVSWTDLCRRGAHRRRVASARRDATTYLGAWCAIEQRDHGTALGTLETLRTSVVPGLASAARADAVNIALDESTADRAAAVLTRHRLADAATLDILAATYVDLGNEGAAFAINDRAIGLGEGTDHEAQCRRLTRRLVLQRSQLAPLMLSRTVFDAPATSPACVHLEAEVRCWLEAARCGDYLRLTGVDPRYATLLSVRAQWTHARRADQFLLIAAEAYGALGVPGASEHLVAALENVRARATTSTCTHFEAEIARLAHAVQKDYELRPELAARIAALASTPAGLCVAPKRF